jgi:peptidoglycan/LPS O-acetylase OafA/YrhL
LSGKSHNHTLDFLRGILALNVCLFHFAYVTLSTTSGNYLAPLAVLNPFRYTLFFLISGFTIPLAMSRHHYQLKHFGNFMKRRFIRLAPAAYASMALIITLQLASIAVRGWPIRGIAFPGFSWNAIAGNLLFHVKIFDTHWYNHTLSPLQIEFQFYALLALTFAALHYSQASRMAYLLFLLGVTCVFEYIPYGDVPVVTTFPYFVLGMLVYATLELKIEKTEIFLMFIAAFAVCWWTQGIAKTFAAFTVVVLLLYTDKLYLRPINFLGTIAYSIFLTHIFTGLLIDGTLKQLFPVPESPAVKTFILAGVMAAVIGVAYLFHRLIEHPLTQRASQIRY